MRARQLILLVLLMAAAGLGAQRPVGGETAVSTAVVQPLTLRDDGLQFTLHTPPANYDRGQLSIAGLTDQIETPGAPALPVYTTFIVLPPTGGAAVTVRAAAVSQRQLSGGPLSPVPEAHLRYNPLDALLDDDPAGVTQPVSRDPDDLFELVLAPDEAIYQADAFYPAVRYELSEPMMARDVRLVRLTLYPIQYNPVSGQLLQAEQLELTVVFDEAAVSVERRPSPTPQDAHIETLRDLVLNFDQIENWRSLPANLEGNSTRLPIGQETYKIEVNQDGVYELSYELLAAAGMDVDNVDPRSFEMLHRGEPVAYQFVGNPNDGFQPGEAVLFYGWDSLGSRLEDQFVRNNVFWLWAGGEAALMASRPSQTGFPLAESFIASVTREENNRYFETQTNQWHQFPNEPDLWYWDYYHTSKLPPYAYTINLPHPAASGPDAVLTAEFLSRPHQVISGTPIPHRMQVTLNNYPEYGEHSWLGIRNVNVTGTVPITTVLPGVNTFNINMATMPIPVPAHGVFLNRITVDYARQFAAVEDELVFTDAPGGGWTFATQGFTAADPNQTLIWDISQQRQPVAVTGGQISGGGPYTVAFGGDHDPGSRFIVTNQRLTPTAVSQYIPPDIDPPDLTADWLAIAHHTFITETERLADHRAEPLFGGLATHVVDIQDVVNQYGYGLHMPQAITDYLKYGLVHWERAPGYLMLVGDATENPRFETCNPCHPNWNHNEPQFVVTDLVFFDRWGGMSPSDSSMSFLVGNDPLPDLAIARLPARTPLQAAQMVDKIIQYEYNHLDPVNYDWLDQVLFIADKPDTSAGNFCQYNLTSGQHLPAFLSQTHHCLPASPSNADRTILRTAMLEAVNEGIFLLNYRGHGSITNWGGSILDTSAAHQNLWQNADRPIVTLSMDCLEGRFSFPGTQGLGETYHRLATGGTAAHWSSTGLGLTTEHSLLQRHFYGGIFEQGHTSIGQAVSYAYLRYFQAGAHVSMIYNFALLGDPAMQLMRPDLHLTQELISSPEVDPGDEMQFRLEVTNEGLYPALTTVVSELGQTFNYVSAEANLPLTVDVGATAVSLNLSAGANPNRGLPYGETAVITLTLQVDPTFGGPGALHSRAETPGLPITPGANEAVTPFIVSAPTVVLIDFDSRTLSNGVELSWTTGPEYYTQGFQLWRSADGGQTFIYLSGIGLIPSQGDGGGGADYAVVDTTANHTQPYWYELRELKQDADTRILTPRHYYPPTVSLDSFTAVAAAGQTELAWVTAVEDETAGFLVARSLAPGGPFDPLPGIPMIPAAPGGYTAVDETAVADTPYWYRLIEVKANEDQRVVSPAAPVYFPSAVLTAFAAQTLASGVELSWTTAAEFYAAGFQLWRSDDNGQTFTYLSGVGQIPALGGNAAGATYTAVDPAANHTQTYWYQLREIKQDNDVRILSPHLYYPPTSQLNTFAATAASGGTRLEWVTTTELATEGFLVKRSLSQGGPYQLLPGISLVPAAGAGSAYLAIDSAAADNTLYWYQLVEVKEGGDQRPLAQPAQIYFPNVQLTAFTAQSVHTGVQLNWTTGPELGSQGFWLEHSVNGGSTFTRLTSLGLIPAQGGSAGGAAYQVVDSSAQRNQLYVYRLFEQKAVEFPALRLLELTTVPHRFVPPPWKLYLPMLLQQP